MAQFSLSGALLGSFLTGMTQTAGLAMDYADRTLWLSNEQTWFQFGTDGTQLGTQAYVDGRGIPLYGTAIRGAEFAVQPVPEPGSLTLVSSLRLNTPASGTRRCVSSRSRLRP